MWQTVNEVSKRKSTSWAASQEEWIYMWKEHFKNLLGKSSKATDKPITKIINYQQHIKQGYFTQEELIVVLTKIKNKKICWSSWNTTRNMEDKEIRWPTAPILQRTEHNKRMDQDLHPPFPQERWPWNCQELLSHNPHFHSG